MKLKVLLVHSYDCQFQLVITGGLQYRVCLNEFHPIPIFVARLSKQELSSASRLSESKRNSKHFLNGEVLAHYEPET